MKKRVYEAAAFSGKGRSIFLGNGCDCKNEYTVPSPGKPARSFLGALGCPFFAIKKLLPSRLLRTSYQTSSFFAVYLQGIIPSWENCKLVIFYRL
jgi:hypothetical protein